MLTEIFLNSCFSVCLNEKAKIKKDKILFRDILDVLTFYEKEKSIQIQPAIQIKFECIKKICEMKLEDKAIDNILDSLSFGEKFKILTDFITLKRTEEIKDAITLDHVRQIRLRKKLNSLFKNYDQLTNFIETLNSGTFDSIDDIVLDYEQIIKTLYSTMMQENRGVSIEASASLDLSKDNYSSVLELILKKYERKNAVSTGFAVFDVDVLNGGFEPSRTYIFGGASGAGKSTLLNNFIINSAANPMLINNENANELKVYIYITLENTIEESLLRTYQPLFSKTIAQTISDIREGVDIKDKIMKELSRNNSTIIMKYFPAMSISTVDIMAVMDDALETYGPNSIKGVYIDYLDLLRTDTKYDLYRLELGQITLSLKTMAVEYNVPIITATQLGRSAYRIESSHDLNLDQIAESIKKVEHSDFVALLAKNAHEKNLIHLKVAKNRSGSSNVAIDFRVDFSRFKFLNGTKVEGKSENTPKLEQKSVNFEGLVKLDF